MWNVSLQRCKLPTLRLLLGVKMRFYEWWVDKEELKQVLKKCIKETKSLQEYLIELFNLQVPCNVVVRLIVEGT